MFTMLVVEDDHDLCELYGTVLEERGWHAVTAENGRAALEAMQREPIDLVITDLMLPEVDGFQLTARLRAEHPELPILMITARGAAADKRRGFAHGTDDYMVKPIDVNEMVWRIEALLRRARIARERVVRLGATTLDIDSMELVRDGARETLPCKEFLLLCKLASSPNRVFTRRQIMDEVWGVDSQVGAHTLDVHVNRLRERLKDNPDISIATVRGLGYKAVSS